MSIRARFNLALGILAMGVLIVQAVTFYQSRAELRDVQVTTAAVDHVEQASRLLSAISDLRLHVVQVQQFLTDVSATRALDGLDDGFDKAAEHAAAFAESLQVARTAVAALHIGEVAAALDEVEQAFGPYQARGQAMAKAYVADGPAGGNPLMEGFDQAAAAMTASIGRLMQVTDASCTAVLAELRAANGSVEAGATLLAGIFVLAALAGFTALWWAINRGIVDPLAAITAAMRRLARGDLAVEVPAAACRDEVGQLVEALAAFKVAAEAKIAADAAASQALRAKESEKRGAMLDLAARLEAAVGGAAHAVADGSVALQELAGTLTTNAGDLSQRSTAVSEASSHANESLQSMAAATEQLSAAIGSIAEQAAQAVRCTGSAVDTARRTSGHVDELTTAATRIGQVVEIIAGITEQTNLLALNATIEAARAGEAGRGFAVVANEVKALAGQTAKATDEIGGYVDAIRQATEKTVADTGATASAIGQMDQIGTMIAGAVEEQRAATRQIAQHVDEAARSTRHIASEIGGIDGAARDVDRSARSMLGRATDLTGQSKLLQQEVAGLLRHIRAA